MTTLPPIASMKRVPTTIGGTTNGNAPTSASHARKPRSRCARHTSSAAVTRFIASIGSFSATSVGPSSHISGAARYASTASR